MNIKFIILATLLSVFFLTSSCGKGFFKKVDTRQVPISGPERAKKNVKEGRGVSLGSIIGKDGKVADTFASFTKPSSSKFLKVIKEEIKS